MLYRMLNMILVVLLGISGAQANDAEIQSKIKDVLKKLVPDAEADRIAPTPIAGLYEVNYGAEVFYVTEDARYLFQGAIADLQTQANLTEKSKVRARGRLLENLDEDEMVVFSPEKPKHTITVFTDTDCTYCRKLHSEMSQFNSNDIKVRYLWFPRAGPNSEAFNTAVSVWCAKDRNAAMDKAKSGGKVKDANCENPVLEQFQLGQQMGVRGTPAILLEDGELITGYRPAKEIAAHYREQDAN